MAFIEVNKPVFSEGGGLTLINGFVPDVSIMNILSIKSLFWMYWLRKFKVLLAKVRQV